MNPTPYILKPPVSVLLQRLSLFSRYSAMAVLGVILFTSFVGAVQIIGVSMVIAAGAAAISVMISKYRLEWVALLPLIGMSIVTAILLAPLSTGAIIILLVVASISMIERYVHLVIVARTLRALPSKE